MRFAYISGTGTTQGGSVSQRRDWTHEERLIAFYVYATEPFGRLHKGNPLIIKLAAKIGRSPSALAMKALNFASLDPTHKNRGVSGLGNASSDDLALWEAFCKDPERIAAESEAVGVVDSAIAAELEIPTFLGETELRKEVSIRGAQGFFRKAVLSSYGGRCAISGIAVPELLNASHIIPWRDNASCRADPRNGIALNALYDRAFDRGFFTLDEELRVRLSTKLPKNTPLLNIAGMPVQAPTRWAPLPEYLHFHRQHVFLT